MTLIKILNKSLTKSYLNLCKFVSTNTSMANVCHNYSENVLDFNDFKSLAQNIRLEHKIKIILNEYQMYRNSDENRDRVPTRLTVRHMKELMECSQMVLSKTRRWFDLSSSVRKHLFYKLRRAEDFNGSDQIVEPLMPFDLNQFYTNRLKISSLFGQNVVFDLSFDEHMSTMECKNLAEQLYRIYQFNRYDYLKLSPELPFSLNLCNVNKSGKTFKFLEFLYPDIVSDKSYVNITTKSYLDVFPKQELVYLSPHADHVMTEYDNSATFIIGGIVDRKQVITLSFPKAIEQNIRSMRLPIDSLITKTNIQALDSVFKLLYEFNAFGINNENSRFEHQIRRHIPSHKLKSTAETAYHRLRAQELEELNDEFDADSYENFDSKIN